MQRHKDGEITFLKDMDACLRVKILKYHKTKNKTEYEVEVLEILGEEYFFGNPVIGEIIKLTKDNEDSKTDWYFDDIK